MIPVDEVVRRLAVLEGQVMPLSARIEIEQGPEARFRELERMIIVIPHNESDVYSRFKAHELLQNIGIIERSDDESHNNISFLVLWTLTKILILSMTNHYYTKLL